MSEQKLSTQELLDLLDQYTVEELDKILSVFGKYVEYTREYQGI